ncbi:MAG: hypothetical protein ACOC3J_04790 [Gemmatimonadota bacterium]
MALPSCELTSVEVAAPRDVVVAEAYLRADLPTQELFLHRTLPRRDGSLRVDGAAVTIRDARGGELELVEARNPEACARYEIVDGVPGGTCYVSPVRVGFVRPGERYTLNVVLPDGGRLRGAATVPGGFEITRPSMSPCALDTARYTITWTESAGAGAYQTVARFENLAAGLAARGVEDPPDELDLLGLAIGAADTTIVFPDEFGVFDRFSLDRDLLIALLDGLPAGASARVLVAAGDRNFINWVRGGNFNPSGQVRVPSITGDGTGVFGALVVRTRTVVARGPGVDLPSCE